MVVPGGLRVGYFTQYQIEELDPAYSPLEHMSRLMPDAPPKIVRANLGRFGFSGDKATLAIERMSGGERARLSLALVTRDAPHLLILDEPTNHLDVDARETLVQALSDYEGAVVVVSHDRHLLELTADRLILVDKGTAREFDGTLDDYTDLVLERKRSNKKAERSQRPVDSKQRRRRAAQAREQEQTQRKIIKSTEAEIERLSKRRSELDKAMFDPDSATSEDAKRTMSELLQVRAEISARIEAAEERWLSASQELEDRRQALRPR